MLPVVWSLWSLHVLLWLVWPEAGDIKVDPIFWQQFMQPRGSVGLSAWGTRTDDIPPYPYSGSLLTTKTQQKLGRRLCSILSLCEVWGIVYCYVLRTSRHKCQIHTCNSWSNGLVEIFNNIFIHFSLVEVKTSNKLVFAFHGHSFSYLSLKIEQCKTVQSEKHK